MNKRAGILLCTIRLTIRSKWQVHGYNTVARFSHIGRTAHKFGSSMKFREFSIYGQPTFHCNPKTSKLFLKTTKKPININYIAKFSKHELFVLVYWEFLRLRFFKNREQNTYFHIYEIYTFILEAYLIFSLHIFPYRIKSVF